jgi:hypothetical protein
VGLAGASEEDAKMESGLLIKLLSGFLVDVTQQSLIFVLPRGGDVEDYCPIVGNFRGVAFE